MKEQLLRKHCEGLLAFTDEIPQEDREKLLGCIYEAMEEYSRYRLIQFGSLGEPYRKIEIKLLEELKEKHN